MKEYRKEILTTDDIAYMMDPSVLKLDPTMDAVHVAAGPAIILSL